MCGFLTEYCFESYKISDKNIFADLLALSIHRGPDGTKITSHENFQLGFNRLAILDLSAAGNQPKQSPSLRYHVVFNGEIYNYKELAHTYELNALSSSSDTEVIMHLLDRIGVVPTIKELNGMFAITVIDTQNNQCFLVRDFAGIKPLFYGISEEGVVSASQFDQVFKHPWQQRDLVLRVEIVKEYFAFGYMQAPNTIYENIYQVEPGTIVRIDRNGHLEKQVFCQFNETTKRKNTDSRPLIEVLKSTVSRQLVSDVPIATFLSGGIDSPLISAYAKKEKNDIEAFTVKVNDKHLNESEIAEAYAVHLNLKLHVHTMEGNDLIDSLEDHFRAYSEPFGDFSSIPTYVICRESKKRHTVMLSGDGGDELFFGYPRMLDVLNKKDWFKLPKQLRKPLVRITNKIGLTNTWAPYYKSLSEFIMYKHIQIPKQVLDATFINTKWSKELERLYRFTNASKKSLLQQLRRNEFYAHMQRVLVKVDRASMKNSLEVRVPFLDKEVIHNAWSNKHKLLEDKGDLKRTLKDVLAQEIPEELLNKKKMGFSVPMNNWLKNQLKEDVMHVVFKTSFYGADIMDVSVLQGYVKDFFENKHDNAWGVWHIYAWQKWAYTHLDKKI
jgi:asparagine synthase (glutamine-hydrolysing)